jgi:hypothetical protein
MTELKKPRAAEIIPLAEGAPETETPETKAEIPVDTPRDEESEQETPERKTTRDETIILKLDGLELAKAIVATLGIESSDKPPATIEISDRPGDTPSAIEEIYAHISPNSTNAHAPVWGPQESNAPRRD